MPSAHGTEYVRRAEPNRDTQRAEQVRRFGDRSRQSVPAERTYEEHLDEV